MGFVAGTEISGQQGKISLKLVLWRKVHMTSTRTILCCEKCEIIWKVEGRKHII